MSTSSYTGGNYPILWISDSAMKWIIALLDTRYLIQSIQWIQSLLDFTYLAPDLELSR